MYKNVRLIALWVLGFGFIVTAHAAKADMFDDLNLQPGDGWYQVANSQLEDVFPDPAPAGRTGPRSVMTAWSGGAYDSTRNRLVIWGGGHADYCGNELYVFDVGTLQWQRLTEPSANCPSESNAVAHYSDGLPASRHTYGSLQYVPDMDYFLSAGMSAGYGDPPIDANTVDAYDFDNSQWVKLANKPGNGYNVGAFTAYDPVTGYVWHHGTLNGALARFDPVNNNWATHTSTDLELYMTMAVDPGRRLLVGVGNDQGVRTWNLDNPSASSQKRTTGGNKALESADAPGFAFDPNLNQFVGWAGGKNLYVLNPDNWEWSVITPAGGATPTSADSNGTYGRFRYMPEKNAYIAVNRTNENVYLIKLTSGAGATLPSISISANPFPVTIGGSTTITWSVANADSCTASGGGLSGSVAVSGSQVIGPLNSDVTVTLACSQSGGVQVSRSLSICVGISACSGSGSTSSSSSGGSGSSSSGGTGSDGDAEEDDGGSGGATGLGFLLMVAGLLVWRRRRQGV